MYLTKKNLEYEKNSQNLIVKKKPSYIMSKAWTDVSLKKIYR